MSDPVEITTQNTTVEEWTWALAQSTGSPGGGAGAGLMLAVAASLTSMVAGYSQASEESGLEVSSILPRARALRHEALRLADEDSAASKAFGAAFRMNPGSARDSAISEASVEAAKASAVLGQRALEAIEDLAWLSTHGNRALIADVVVGFGALRSTLAGARTNVSFDLSTLTAAGKSMEEIHKQHPVLWSMVGKLHAGIERIDGLVAGLDPKAAPTDDRS
ncbi:cyclodeaminase/cyclohydrolase family protein [Paeniglutamicibacter antarcticus]|uniref:Cyclodeaminase/cyclohydrolase domain-containing protein n=1 Tax=Paeniglutamicibacter antarcticus TaxID=494023 RepID=A0ABP9TUD8_9MICC